MVDLNIPGTLVSEVIGYGLLADRPAADADNEGWLYYSTDDAGGTLARSDGADWQSVGSSPIFAQDADPGTVGEGKLWIDTTGDPPYLAYVRNAADDAWEQVGSASVITTTGDLIVGDADGEEARLPVGDDGQILMADSGDANGVIWSDNYATYVRTKVRNTTGSTIGAFSVVYLSGSSGQLPLISLADASAENTSSRTIGFTTAAIGHNNNGYVQLSGLLHGPNTNAYPAGTALWLSETAGAFTDTRPTAPAHGVFVGIVVNQGTTGSIEVIVQNGHELDELHDVALGTPDDGDVLRYTDSTGLWSAQAFAHTSLSSVGADDHHAKSHAHSGSDGSGTVAHSALTGINADDHHNQAHALTGADHTVSGLTAGTVLAATGSSTFGFVARPEYPTIVIDGGPAVIATGIKTDLRIPAAGTITGWTLLANASGNIVIDLWKDSLANFPPVVGDSITGANKPTLSSAASAEATGLSWSVAAGDIIRVNVDSATNISRATLALHYARS